MENQSRFDPNFNDTVMENNMNYLSFSNKKIAEYRIIKLIYTLWFVAVKLPIQLIKVLFFSPPADVGLVNTVGDNYHYETLSLTEVMTETYLMEDFSPFETSEKYARLYYSPALGLVVSLIVFGTVMKLNFFKKNSHFIMNETGKYNKLMDTPRRGQQLDLENIPVEYDEELNTWCTLDCSKVIRQGQDTEWVAQDICKPGLPKRVNNYAALAARSLIFSRRRDGSSLEGPYGA